MKQWVCAALASAWALTAAAPAQAQNASADPSYGSVQLASGFTPDPHTVQIQAGGSIDAARLGNSCVGFIADAPDFDLYWTAGSGSLPLAISAASSADTTLVINGPDGNWYCDDDGGLNGLNPSIVFQNPVSGLYDIWIGTYTSGSFQAATLAISELESN